MNHVESLATDAIRARLDAELSRLQVGVAVSFDDGSLTLRASTPAVPAFTTATPIAAGCLAKPIVATLIALAAHEQRLQLDDAVSSWMEGNARSTFPDAVRIHHLLTHTHGLDDSCLQILPRDSGGCIDWRGFSDAVVALPRIAPPGVVFAYGHVGPWIAAALLEKVYAVPYARLLNDRLLVPAGMAGRADETAGVCPANGSGLLLSADDLLTFSRLHHEQPAAPAPWRDALPILRKELSFTPGGWHPVAERMCLGWFDHGGHCYGQNGRGQQQSSSVRLFPAQGVAIAVTAAAEMLSGTIMQRVFGHLLPDVADRVSPRPLSRDEQQQLVTRRYTGEYGVANALLKIETARNGSLRAALHNRDDKGAAGQDPYITRNLLPAAEDVFFPSPPEPKSIAVLRFSDPDVDGRFRYLHTSTRVYARLG